MEVLHGKCPQIGVRFLVVDSDLVITTEEAGLDTFNLAHISTMSSFHSFAYNWLLEYVWGRMLRLQGPYVTQGSLVLYWKNSYPWTSLSTTRTRKEETMMDT